MKKTLAAAALLGLFFLPAAAHAQESVSLDPEFGGRLAFQLDKKLARGLHINLEEEARMDGNFSSFNRLHTTLALNYKVGNGLKLGIGYAMINPYSSNKGQFKNARHRAMVDAKWTLHSGDWQFSVKERLQATFRTGDFNAWQHAQPELALKSRLMVKYKGLRRVAPYGYLELRNTLNAPSIAASYNGTQWLNEDNLQEGDEGWFVSGWNKVYINRLRGSIGVDWRLDKRSTLNLYLLADWVNDYVVDANSAGTVLKEYTHETGFVGQIGVQYTYAF